MTTKLDARLASYSSPFLSIFRIVFGLLFALHGSQKLFDWPIAAAQPIPVGSWPYWWASLIEFVAGLLIAVGLFTRIAAFVAAAEMAVAYLWQHLPNGVWPLEQGGGELALLYGFGFLMLAGMGAGTWSVDGRRRPAARRTAGGPRRRFGRPIR